MKTQQILASLALCLSVAAGADTVVKEVPDKLPGQSFGGLAGLMIGATAGPLGALAGIGAGWLLGGETQAQSGLSGRAYEVENQQGERQIVRSPTREWSAGDQVKVKSRRLVSVNE